MELSMTFILTLPFILGMFCLQQKLELGPKSVNFGPMDNFYNVKMKTLYQCMELCLQFTACAGVTYHYDRCYLHNADYNAMKDKCRCNSKYWERRHFPDHVSGACLNHRCSIDSRCLALTGTSKHVCVPHGLPTFTCPLYWFRNKKSCYRPFFLGVTWQSAYEQCKTEHASLVEIHDGDKAEYIRLIIRHFVSLGYESPSAQLYWIALSDNETDGEWAWRVSGKDLTGNAQWTPNATWEMYVPGNDCAGISIPDYYRWKPINCSSLFSHVCEMLMVT